MRSTWTDSRLDDFVVRVDRRFDELSVQINEQGSRIDRLQHAIFIVGGGIFASFIAVLAAIIGLIATQL